MPIKDKILQVAKNLSRKKEPPRNVIATELIRCLGLVDLTFLSFGTMIGVGLYVTLVQVTREAGPSVILSYLLAAAASILSALCYAELSSRLPLAGSSYQYTYMSIGEIVGFLVGWNVAVEHVVGTASLARSVSSYIDGLLGDQIRNYLMEHTPMPGGFLARFPDFLACGFTILTTILIALGIKLSSRTNIFFGVLNILICVFVIVSGIILGSSDNWTDVKHGGFFPHGWTGTISGAGTLVYAFTGYEVLAATAEEAINPSRNLPLSLLLSIGIITVLYVSVAASFVSIIPWYDIPLDAPLSIIYMRAGWNWAVYLFTIAASIATTSSMIGTSVAVPRYYYAMARDGLLMGFLNNVNEKTGVPVIATLFSGVLTVFMTLMFGLHDLINYSAIGQLVSCISVAFSLIKLRYKPLPSLSCDIIELASKDDDEAISNVSGSKSEGIDGERSPLLSSPAATLEDSTTEERAGAIQERVKDSKFYFLFSWTKNWEPGDVPVYAVSAAILLCGVAIAMLLFGSMYLKQWWFITILCLLIFFAIVNLIFAMMFKQDNSIVTFKIPYAPITPFISILINLTLMMKLDAGTWIRFSVWMLIGLLVYIGYGYRHSKKNK